MIQELSKLNLRYIFGAEIITKIRQLFYFVNMKNMEKIRQCCSHYKNKNKNSHTGSYRKSNKYQVWIFAVGIKRILSKLQMVSQKILSTILQQRICFNIKNRRSKIPFKNNFQTLRVQRSRIYYRIKRF